MLAFKNLYRSNLAFVKLQSLKGLYSMYLEVEGVKDVEGIM